MITALIARQGESIPTVIQQEIGKLSEEHTKILAEAHKKELDKSIEDTRERSLKPTGNHLKDQIQVEKIAESGFSGVINSGYGVGNIAILNVKAPWWAWINFGRAFSGRTIPPGTKENPRITGHFVPGTKGIFTKGQPKFPIDPKKAIKAHNFIEKALGVMISKVRELLK
jgi:hypothetical protein